MILSVSRRTDIPAFYLDWFLNRIEEGYVLVRNPMNYFQVSEVSLDPKLIDCIVFWTKDPSKIIDKLDRLDKYKYYFQVTITSYGEGIERNTPDREEVIRSFKELSKEIGKEKMIWRYDPIILTEEIDIEYHKREFKKIASELSGYTNLCIFSFLDLYKKTKANMKDIDIKDFDNKSMIEIGKSILDIATEHDIRLEVCSEEIDLSHIGIKKSKCIDDKLISKIIGEDINIEKDKNQREICGCVSSIDIGTYDTCRHECTYCYANYNKKVVKNNNERHDVNSPFLVGYGGKEDKIVKRKMEFYRKGFDQLKMF